MNRKSILLIFLAGCSIFPEPENLERLIITAPKCTKMHTPKNVKLLVDTPCLQSFLQTNRVVIKTHPTKIEYIAGVEWADRLDKMLLESIIATLQNDHAVKDVAMLVNDSSGDYILKIDIRFFGLNAQTKSVNVTYHAKLIKSSGLVTQKLFEDKRSYDKSNFIDTLNLAHQSCMCAIEEWLYSSLI